MKKYDVSQEKNMGGITLLYFNDDRPYRKTDISYVSDQTIIIRKQKKNFTKRERDQSGQRGDSGCKGKSSGIKQDGMYNLCDPQSD